MEFPPVCKEIPGCEKTQYTYDQDATCLCSGAWGAIHGHFSVSFPREFGLRFL